MKSAIRFRRIKVTVMDVILPFATLMILNVGFLLAWTIVDPLVWVRIDAGRTQDGYLESFGRCQSSTMIANVMVGLVAAANAVALVLAMVQAYQTRNLNVAFEESKYVTFAMASIMQAFLVGFPVLFLADTNTYARFVVRSVLVFVISMSVLCFIFIPKMMAGDKEMAPVRLTTQVSNKQNSRLSNGASGDPSYQFVNSLSAEMGSKAVLSSASNHFSAHEKPTQEQSIANQVMADEENN